MKRVLFTFSLAALLVALIVPAVAAGEAVTVGTGNLKIGGLVQSGFNYYVGPEQLDTENYRAVDRDQDMEFILKRARMILSGAIIDERVSYFAQLEFAQDSNAEMGDFLLDAKIGFHYIPYTGIYVGRILPQFTHFGPRHAGTLFLIDYPMLNQYIAPAARQTGIDIAVRTTYVNANLGAFNGREYDTAFVPAEATEPVGNAGWGDQNTGKDVYFTLVGKPPVEGLKVFAGMWYGTPLDGFEDEDGKKIDRNASVLLVDAGISYLAPFGLTAVTEMIYADYEWDSRLPSSNFDRSRADDTTDLNALSYYVMLGYNFGPMFEFPIELLVRYDYLDPDTEDNDETHERSESDGLTDITAGVNYYIMQYHAMLSLNYIYHGEQWEDVNNLAGDDTQDGISNDVLKLQAQVAW